MSYLLRFREHSLLLHPLSAPNNGIKFLKVARNKSHKYLNQKSLLNKKPQDNGRNLKFKYILAFYQQPFLYFNN